MKIDSLSKSVFAAAGASLHQAFASSSVSKACTVWVRQFRQSVSSGVSTLNLTELGSKLLHASKFLCVAYLELACLAGRVTANSASIRFSVWLNYWMEDCLQDGSHCSAILWWWAFWTGLRLKKIPGPQVVGAPFSPRTALSVNCHLAISSGFTPFQCSDKTRRASSLWTLEDHLSNLNLPGQLVPG